MTTVHELPEGWRWVRFGEVVRQVKETTKDPESDDLTRIVGLDHLDAESLPLIRWNELDELPDGTSFTRVFRAGQVLFGKRRAYQRKVAVPDFDGVCSGDILVFDPSSSELLREFLPYVVQSDGFLARALNTSSGSLSPRTRWKDLASFSFALPPREQQARIVTVLEAASALRARYADAEVAAAQTREAMFADHALAAGDDAALADLVDITVGIVIRPADLYVETGGVRALRSLNVLPGRLVEDELVRISAEGHRERTKSQLHGDEVVVVRSGRPGDAAVIPADGLERHAIDLLIVRCGPNIRPHYLASYLNSASGRARLSGRSAGTAQQHLNVGQLKQVRVPLVELHTQDQVVQSLSMAQSVGAKLRAAQEDVTRSQQALRERLLGGHCDV